MSDENMPRGFNWLYRISKLAQETLFERSDFLDHFISWVHKF